VWLLLAGWQPPKASALYPPLRPRASLRAPPHHHHHTHKTHATTPASKLLRPAHLLLFAGMQPCWLALIIALGRFFCHGNVYRSS
jgi:hypothetical protein